MVETVDKQDLLNRVNGLIRERKVAMLKKLPNVHKIDDGIIIRFFTDWDNCEDDDNIKFKKIINHDNPDESIVFFYIPKGGFFDLSQRFYIGCITCLNGKIHISSEKKSIVLEGYSKICIDSAEVQGLAIENTYFITTSNRKNWSEETYKHVEKTHGIS